MFFWRVNYKHETIITSLFWSDPNLPFTCNFSYLLLLLLWDLSFLSLPIRFLKTWLAKSFRLPYTKYLQRLKGYPFRLLPPANITQPTAYNNKPPCNWNSIGEIDFGLLSIHTPHPLCQMAWRFYIEVESFDLPRKNRNSCSFFIGGRGSLLLLIQH